MNDLAAASLGALVKDYRLSASRIREISVIMLISGAVAACFFLTALLSDDTSLDGLRTRIGLTLPGLLFTLPVIFGVRQLIMVGGSSLSLYEDGLVYRRRGQALSTTWDEVDSTIADAACRITKKDGTVIEFGASIEGLADVMDVIEAQTLRRMLPAARAAIQSGGTVEFKGLKLPGGKGLNRFAQAASGYAVDARGISSLDHASKQGNQSLPWGDVTDYGVAQARMGRVPVDVFFIRAGETQFRTRLGLLNNAHLLIALCEELAPRPPEEESSPEGDEEKK